MNVRSLRGWLFAAALVMLLAPAAASAANTAADTPLKEWEGSYVSMAPMWEDPVADSLYPAVAEAGRKRGKNYTTIIARRLISRMSATEFERMDVTGDTVTFHAPGGTFLPVKVRYRSEGTAEVKFGEHTVVWHLFRAESSPVRAYDYLIATEIHAHGDGPGHWHMRYGAQGFEHLMNAKDLAYWWPTMVGPDFSFAEHVKGLSPKVFASYLP